MKIFKSPLCSICYWAVSIYYPWNNLLINCLFHSWCFDHKIKSGKVVDEGITVLERCFIWQDACWKREQLFTKYFTLYKMKIPSSIRLYTNLILFPYDWLKNKVKDTINGSLFDIFLACVDLGREWMRKNCTVSPSNK